MPGKRNSIERHVKVLKVPALTGCVQLVFMIYILPRQRYYAQKRAEPATPKGWNNLLHPDYLCAHENINGMPWQYLQKPVGGRHIKTQMLKGKPGLAH